MRNAPLLGALSLVLVAAGLAMPDPAAGQAPLAPTGPFGSVLAGIDGTDPGVHAFGGVGGGVMLHRLGGIEGVGLAGGGASYTSLLVAAGPSLRLVADPRGELRLWGGGGWYREALSGGVDAAPRSMASGVVGLSGRTPVGRVHLAAGVIHWRGRADGDGFVRSPVASGWRLMVGVGR